MANELESNTMMGLTQLINEPKYAWGGIVKKKKPIHAEEGKIVGIDENGDDEQNGVIQSSSTLGMTSGPQQLKSDQQKGSGVFTNIQKYAAQNQPAIENMSQNVVGRIGQAASNLTSDITKKTGETTDKYTEIGKKFQAPELTSGSDIKSEPGSFMQGEDLIDKALTGGTFTDEEKKNFRTMGGTYDPITSQAVLPDRTDYTKEQLRMSALEDLGNKISTPEGVQQALRQTYDQPGYTRGLANLDEYLFARGGKQAENISNVRSSIDAAKKASEAQMASLEPLSVETKSKIERAKAALDKRLQTEIGTGELGSFQGGILGAAEDRGEFNQQLRDALTKSQGEGGDLSITQEMADRLGLTSGQELTLGPKGELNPLSDYIGGSRFGENLSPEDRKKLASLGELTGQHSQYETGLDYDYIDPSELKSNLGELLKRGDERFQAAQPEITSRQASLDEAKRNAGLMEDVSVLGQKIGSFNDERYLKDIDTRPKAVPIGYNSHGEVQFRKETPEEIDARISNAKNLKTEYEARRSAFDEAVRKADEAGIFNSLDPSADFQSSIRGQAGVISEKQQGLTDLLDQYGRRKVNIIPSVNTSVVPTVANPVI